MEPPPDPVNLGAASTPPGTRRWEPFRDFMARALYDPADGYYTRRTRGPGRRGDFATSATLSDDLGRATAGWIRAEFAHWGGQVRDVIEVGPGDGSLTAAVRAHLPWWLRRRLRFHLVEVSPVLTELQQRRLGGAARWHTEIGEAVAAAGGDALVYSNELVDAFPCSVWEWSAQGRCWHAVGVAGGALVASETEATTRPHCSALDPSAWPGGAPPDGQHVETHESYRDWLGGWLPKMRRLSLLTIDYGDTFPALYHRRPAGTLRAYFHHQHLTGPDVVLRPGHQDLTADVNFSDLAAWERALGVEHLPLQTQAVFLGDAGTRGKGCAARPPLGFLASPDGAGQAFKVLRGRLGGSMAQG
jgi:SAM-dependent MidA family methyltransferase